METDILIGIALAAVSFASVVIITLWSRSRIERIAAKGYRTARETIRDETNGK